MAAAKKNTYEQVVADDVVRALRAWREGRVDINSFSVVSVTGGNKVTIVVTDDMPDYARPFLKKRLGDPS